MAGGGITYDGVAGGGGTIFEGLKFWVALRVPIRKDLLRMISDNGGEVVRLEKQAEILIADHVRKDAPPGSCSWRFIEDSVKNGKLEDVEKYVIKPRGSGGRAVQHTHPAGPAPSPKGGGRSRFTREDDELLMKWATRMEQKRERLGGNKLYQEFAQRHPNHSWHSWRDRWIKKLSFLPRPELSDEDVEAIENGIDDTAPLSTSRSSTIRAAGESRIEDARPPSPPRTPIVKATPGAASATRNGVPRARNIFTEEDDELLRQYVSFCAEAGFHLKGNAMYIALADEYPHHTYQSWRDRWVRHLSKEELPNPARLPPAHTALPNRPRDEIGEPPANPSAAEGRRSPGSTTSKPNTRSTQEKKKPKKNAAEEEIAHREQLITSFQALAKGALTRIALQSSEDGNHSEAEEDVPESSARATKRPAPRPIERTESEIFYGDLRDFVQHTGHKVNIWPTVQRRVVDLWDLWSAARADNEHRVLRNWEKISEVLGFDWIEFPTVTRELRDCFQDNLGFFETVIDEWNNEEDEDDEPQDEEQINGDEGALEEVEPTTNPENLRAEPIIGTQEPEPEFTSSPPKIHNLKRRLGAELSTPVSAGKRTRYASNGEVPSTPPHEETDTDNLPPGDDLAESPPQRSPTRVSSRIESLLQGYQSSQSKMMPTDRNSRQAGSPIIGTTPLPRVLDEPRCVDPMPPSPAPRASAPRASTSRASTSRDRSNTPQTERATPRDPSGQHFKGKLASTDPSGVAVRRSLPSSFPRSSQKDVSSATRLSLSNPRGKPTSRGSPRVVPQSTPRQTPVPKPQQTGGRHNGVGPTPGSSAPPNGAGSGLNLVETIERFISMGYAKPIALKALKATTLVPGEAGLVMESLMRGDGIPSHHEGIWTERDDEALKLVNSAGSIKVARSPAEVELKRRVTKERTRLLAKHGIERIEARTEFLNSYGLA